MAEEGKKISFGFAKSIKKPLIKSVPTPNEKKVDYIECIDEKAIKIIGGEEKKDEPLVIPLLGSKTWHDRIINKIDADIFEPKPSDDQDTLPKVEIKQESEDIISNGDVAQTITTPVQVSNIKQEPSEEPETAKTLEEQAAQEIIRDLKSSDNEKQEKNTLALPVVENASLRGQEESTLEDYEQIPIDEFGVAMLRGMGWQPGKGIGRNEKVVAPAIPELRPKGMGLGADKMTLQKQKSNAKSNQSEEELMLKKGSFVKFVAGKQSDSYGEVQGFDEDSGRLIIKMALGGDIISVNEFMVQPVTKSEYSKNAKILTLNIVLN